MSDDQKPIMCSSRYIKLNVGGYLFYTTVDTLTKHETSLKTMISDGADDVIIDSEGCILIDRCGKHFGTILNFLRDGTTPLLDNLKEIAELFTEAQYYNINELEKICQRMLARDVLNNELICRVPLVTSRSEANYIIRTSKKFVVKLLFNRHNNKYSYTHSSVDNLLKNLELFDRLTLRYFGRILFIKDVDEISDEICCWSFFKHGKHYETVCCTSNVYETDRMYTKVEFPESRIVEETEAVVKSSSNRSGVEIMKLAH